MEEQRLDYRKLARGGYEAMLQLEAFVRNSDLEPRLLELIKLRASQINGCAYCIDMHTNDARALGETEQRLYGATAWAETPFYTPRERAALAWTEAVTRISEGHAPRADYDDVREHFSEAELAALTMAIVAINGWNRLAIAFRVPPGSYHRAVEADPQTEPPSTGSGCYSSDDAHLDRHFGDGTRDVVEEASWESFPASDAPAW